MPTTVGRSRGRQGVHSGAQGAAGDHMRKIIATLITAVVVLVAVLVLTKAGRDIDAATQRFMLYYAGVLALVGLTGSVLLGLVATDRIVMTPGHRVMAQAVHRAFSFGTLAFLIIHIVTEILAQRSHVIDAVVPFLSPYRTFYIGLGTIASDLIVLLVVTSILRKRFTEHGKAWRWRAIHYASYVAFVFAVLHGLLGGRTAKPYVDWSYGFAIAVTALGLAVRFLAISLRPKESLPSSPSADRARPAGSSPLHAAALGLAQARLGSTIGGTVQVLPGRPGRPGRRGLVGRAARAGPVTGLRTAAGPGSRPGLRRAVRRRLPRPRLHAAGRAAVRRRWPGRDAGPSLRVRGPVAPGAGRPRPAAALRTRVRRTAPVRGRAEGTRRRTPGRAVLLPVRTAGPRPAARAAVPRGLPGPSRIRPASHPARRCRSRRIPGPPCPRRPAPGTGIPARFPSSEPVRWLSPATGPMPRPDTGPLPRAGQGPPPRNGMGPGTGPMPRAGTGPMPRADSGPMPRLGTGPMPRPGTGPHATTGHRSHAPPGTGRCRAPTRVRCRGPVRGSRRATAWVRVRVRCRARVRVPCRGPTRAPMPRLGTGPMPRFDGRPDTGPLPRPDTGAMPSRPGTGPMPRPGTGPMPRPRPGPSAGAAAAGTGAAHRPAAAGRAARVTPGHGPLTRDIATCRGRPEVTSGNEPDQGS